MTQCPIVETSGLVIINAGHYFGTHAGARNDCGVEVGEVEVGDCFVDVEDVVEEEAVEYLA